MLLSTELSWEVFAEMERGGALANVVIIEVDSLVVRDKP
jgi:hypothetical protein